MNSIEKLKDINKVLAEPFVRLALADYSKRLIQGTITSPAIEHFKLKEVANQYLAWYQEAEKEELEAMGVTLEPQKEEEWPDHEDWDLAEQRSLGGLTKEDAGEDKQDDDDSQTEKY